jgi:dTDP-4-amino-4,6-dideoxygalactose transaminase
MNNKKYKIAGHKYWFTKESINYITENIQFLLENGEYLTEGKYCREFEQEFSRYIGVKHAIVTSSGTSALDAILQSLEVKGFEVIVPTNTFIATAAAVIRAGGIPVFADSDDYLNLDIDDAIKRITSKTKAIIIVHIGGLISPRIEELREYCDKKGIYLIEDAAHAHGSKFKGKMAGSFGHAAAFSFFSTKVMSIGEGGMVVTNDEELAERIKILKDQGKTFQGIYQNIYSTLGNNWRMTEFQAIIGLAQLKLIEESISRREKIAKIYDEKMRNTNKVEARKIPEKERCNFYKYVVYLKDPKLQREKIYEQMKELFGISLSGFVYEIPLHKQPIFENLKISLPKAEKLCSSHICLPIYPTLTSEEAEYIIDSLLSLI